MTPEKLERGNDLLDKISTARRPLSALKEDQAHADTITIACFSDRNYNTSFSLKADQMQAVIMLVRSMAEKNLNDLESEFERL